MSEVFMSLARDFMNYYGNSYVGFKATADSPVIPFFITNVQMGRNHHDGDYSDEAVAGLRFSGYTVEGEDRNRDRNGITLSSGKIVLDLPELGYITVRGRSTWIQYQPIRSMRKGLCGRRVEGLGGVNFGDEHARQVYLEANTKPEPLDRHFLIQGEELHYKGRRIGSVRNGNYEVFIPYRYLSHFVRKVYGEDVVVNLVEENQDA